MAGMSEAGKDRLVQELVTQASVGSVTCPTGVVHLAWLTLIPPSSLRQRQ